MTSGLLCSLRNKQKLSIKTHKHQNNHKLRAHYLRSKNKFTTILRIAKNNYYIKKLKEVSYRSKLTYKLMNDIVNTKTEIKNDE